jgi:hypothetical protein
MKLEVEEGKELHGEYINQTQDERNKGILAAWLPIWVRNAFENYDHIMNEAKSQHMCISSLGKVKDRPAVIVGSGPSLDKTAPLLKDWKGAVFACGSNALIPTRWGHQPEYICVFDGGDTLYPKLMGYDWKGSMLLCHPSISPLILKSWKWEKRYYLMVHYGIQWFDEIQPLAYGDYMRFQWQTPPCIMRGIANAGCTSNNAIQLANYLGYGPLFLIGVDLGYPEGKERCTRWVFQDNQWKDIGPDSYNDRKLHKADNGVLTTEEQIEYKSAMMAVYKWDKPQLFDCSEGIITELPKLNFQEVVEKNGQGFAEFYRTDKEIERICDDYENSRQRLQSERIVDRPGEEPIDTIRRISKLNSGEIQGKENSVNAK